MKNDTLEIETVSKLAKVLDENNLTEIEYDTDEIRIRVVREGSFLAPQVQSMPVASSAPAQADAPKDDEPIDYANHPDAVKSPMVGVAYVAPEPGAPSYVKEGDKVVTGDTLVLVEAMKTFNPVKATKSGVVKKVLIEDGMPVEFGEPLMIIE